MASTCPPTEEFRGGVELLPRLLTTRSTRPLYLLWTSEHTWLGCGPASVLAVGGGAALASAYNSSMLGRALAARQCLGAPPQASTRQPRPRDSGELRPRLDSTSMPAARLALVPVAQLVLAFLALSAAVLASWTCLSVPSVRQSASQSIIQSVIRSARLPYRDYYG
ncbi:hypothetical protein CYMTET_8847 [Cymbomonas tetramitiformis]|uniref:Uncharacterized protein n=1 Tax=Cymbomonas tetramitiformis TaxID=36881 RepID=A0AAE0GSM1_9CHLO|nr:hypothetical protein CYMTET_8847 [Cymbomonas tetramitiformis]